MDQEETRRVVTTLPLLIDRVEHPAGTVLELPARAAQEMVDEGRARFEREDGSDPDPAPTPASEFQELPQPSPEHEEH